MDDSPVSHTDATISPVTGLVFWTPEFILRGEGDVYLGEDVQLSQLSFMTKLFKVGKNQRKMTHNHLGPRPQLHSSCRPTSKPA